MDLARDRILPNGTHWISEEFSDRFALEEDRGGTTGKVVELVAAVDAQVAIDRGQQVLGSQGPLGGKLAPAIGRADDLSHPQAAARNERGLGIGPVVSAGQA